MFDFEVKVEDGKTVAFLEFEEILYSVGFSTAKKLGGRSIDGFVLSMISTANQAPKILRSDILQ